MTVTSRSAFLIHGHIQVDSANATKHSTVTHCRYYHVRHNGKWCEISDETDRTASIFEELMRPFEELEREIRGIATTL